MTEENKEGTDIIFSSICSRTSRSVSVEPSITCCRVSELRNAIRSGHGAKKAQHLERERAIGDGERELDGQQERRRRALAHVLVEPRNHHVHPAWPSNTSRLSV